MKMFVDTSGIFSLLDLDDRSHSISVQAWAMLEEQRAELITSNYVLLKPWRSLVDAWVFKRYVTSNLFFVPILHIYWVDESLHERAVALMTAGVRDLSLVMCQFRANAASWHRHRICFRYSLCPTRVQTRSLADMRVFI